MRGKAREEEEEGKHLTYSEELYLISLEAGNCCEKPQTARMYRWSFNVIITLFNFLGV
jgi:hypothetical protein